MDQNSQNKTGGDSAENKIVDNVLADEAPDVAFELLPVIAPRISLEEIKRLRPSRWAVNLVAISTLLSGLVGAIQPLAARLAEHPRLFSVLVPNDYYHFSKSLHVAFGLFLIYLSINSFLSANTMRWLAAVVLSAGSALLHIARVGA